MTDQDRLQAFLDEAKWSYKTLPTNRITEVPIGSREEIYYITHDTMICFRYCDLYFREGTLVGAVRCKGRENEHEEPAA